MQPRDSEDLEALVRVKKLDAAMLGRPQADALQEHPGAGRNGRRSGFVFGMRFFTPQFPYNDVRFRRAVSIALDRRAMIDRFFDGSGGDESVGELADDALVPPQQELVTLPGYRTGAAGRGQDIAEARALLAAFASQSTVPADNALFVIDEAEAAVGIGSLMRDQLKATLDLNVSVYAISIQEFVKRLFRGRRRGRLARTPGTSTSTTGSTPTSTARGRRTAWRSETRTLTPVSAQRTAFDASARQALGYEIQRKLMGLDVAVNFVSERVSVLSWPYVHNFPVDVTDGYQHRFADTSIDVTHPSFRGRP